MSKFRSSTSGRRAALLSNGLCRAIGKKRGTPCGQPAMANGLCRFHGGQPHRPYLRHGGKSRKAVERRTAVLALLKDEGLME